MERREDVNREVMNDRDGDGIKREYALEMVVEENKFLQLKNVEQEMVDVMGEKGIDN